MQSSSIIIFIIIFMILIQQRNRTAWLASRVASAKKEDKTHMKELAKAFIGKECLVYTVNSQTLTGSIKEVTDGAILLQSESTNEAVNLDFIVRIREYPRNKKGKKKSVVID